MIVTQSTLVNALVQRLLTFIVDLFEIGTSHAVFQWQVNFYCR